MRYCNGLIAYIFLHYLMKFHLEITKAAFLYVLSDHPTYIYHSTSGFLAQELGSLAPQCQSGWCRKFCFQKFDPFTSYIRGGGAGNPPISSSFNSDETCHIHLYAIYPYRCTSGFLAQELVWEQETEKYRKQNFDTPMTLGGGGLATQLILFQS